MRLFHVDGVLVYASDAKDAARRRVLDRLKISSVAEIKQEAKSLRVIEGIGTEGVILWDHAGCSQISFDPAWLEGQR